jgi:hypothetical protein
LGNSGSCTTFSTAGARRRSRPGRLLKPRDLEYGEFLDLTLGVLPAASSSRCPTSFQSDAGTVEPDRIDLLDLDGPATAATFARFALENWLAKP